MGYIRQLLPNPAPYEDHLFRFLGFWDLGGAPPRGVDVSELEREENIKARLEKLDDAETKAKVQAVKQHPLFPKYQECLRVEVFGAEEIPEFGSGDEDEELVSWELRLTDPKHQHVPANTKAQTGLQTQSAETAVTTPTVAKAVEKPVSLSSLALSKSKAPPVFTSQATPAPPPSSPTPTLPKAPKAKAPYLRFRMSVCHEMLLQIHHWRCSSSCGEGFTFTSNNIKQDVGFEQSAS